MGDVVAFKKIKPSQKFKGRELCKSGFHKWQVVSENRFDVKQGKLVTSYRCLRCGATRNEAR
ncbi:MAG: hypothetical protein HUJ29_08090 [Gammaproteobacteria bacterium]|nr:hypothetical protein [Gammaproteobacteria bacterium]